jgi:Fic-DOC domain mobile mystery protein B
MFGDVWNWAGNFRKTDKNIGINWVKIRIALKMLMDDTLFGIMNKTYTSDEIAIRFKHRLVSIHCFSNGSGRHSRIMADIIRNKIFGNDFFNWSASKNVKDDVIRKQYIDSLKSADKGEIKPLIKFASYSLSMLIS